jgi:hypothetical protein
MSAPKLHHYVPQVYLARFGQDELVLVKRRDPAKVHEANVKNVAAETGFYTIVTDAGAKSTIVEESLSDLDGLGAEAMRWIDEHEQPPPAGSREREILCEYLAVQFNRTPRTRGAVLFPRRVAEYADGREITEELVADYLEQRHLGHKPSAREARAAWTFVHGARAETGGDPTHTDAVKVTLSAVEACMRPLRARHWRLETCRKPNFLTSDAPLVLWRRPSARDRYLGVGLEDADEIRFPLDGHKQLVLVPGQGSSVNDVCLGRMWECNRDLAAACERVVVGHPTRTAWTNKIALRKRGPVLRFNMAPGVRENPDGSEEPMGDVLHLSTR